MYCKQQFIAREKLNVSILWQEYTQGKQTYLQLAQRYNCSTKTIQHKLDEINIEQKSVQISCSNVLMDTTYFGRKLGVMVFKDSITGYILFKQYVKQETNFLYLCGINEIKKLGIEIQSIICDGRKGLLQLFPSIPIQMCNFHQVAIVRRYLTKTPKIQASKELWELILMLKQTDMESFEAGLEQWYEQWKDFLNERNLDSSGKNRYVHKRLRSAYRSLKTNLPWLFTWYDFMELNIPNTTNTLDGQFSNLKNKLRNHNGLSEVRKKKFIDAFFKA